jgi:asparagine synthase (glutamine-hydrolysing)
VDEHLNRRLDHGNRIWLLLSAEVWYRRYIGGRSTGDLEAELSEVPSANAVGTLARSVG